ncbi:MAG: cyclic nucleotide-binding domain-containing protein [Verrucomicrobia bacterium]|nr:cyclic nucleotide-binding domain-containing protein [Verrucomicrobiota bacterium]
MSGCEPTPFSSPAACPPANNKLFAGLDCATIATFLQRCVPMDYRVGGGKVFEEGSAGDYLYLIESGRVRVFKSLPDGTEETLGRVGPGDYFGEMAFFGHHGRSAGAEPETDCRLWRMDFPTFETLLRADLGVTRNLLENANDRLRRTDDRYIAELVQRERFSVVGRMAASIIHDFKNPMTTIRGMAEWVKSKHHEPDTAENLQLIMDEVDRMVEMTTEVLDYCRSKTQLNPEPTQLHVFFDEAMKPLRLDFERRGIRLETQVHHTDAIPLDRRRFTRVIYNLAINAADAMPEGGALRFHAARDGDMVHIQVTDSGCGIPPESQEKIWQPFVTMGKKHGTGLGLPIVRKIVEDHGGTITLQSKVGQGTTFAIRLPIQGKAAKE